MCFAFLAVLSALKCYSVMGKTHWDGAVPGILCGNKFHTVVAGTAFISTMFVLTSVGASIAWGYFGVNIYPFSDSGMSTPGAGAAAAAVAFSFVSIIAMVSSKWSLIRACRLAPGPMHMNMVAAEEIVLLGGKI